MASTLPCPAWVYCNNGNAHVAKDRNWFGNDYTPFQSFITDIVGNRIEVVGIGTVDLPTQPDPGSHSMIRLENVLHAPSTICNFIGGLVLHDHWVAMSFSPSGPSGGICSRSHGHPVAYFKSRDEGGRFCEVKLSEPPVGPSVGPSPFDPSSLYVLHASWPDSERQRYAALQGSRQTGATASGPLTRREKAWLKTHYGNEFRFLQSYGLSLYKDEDREEGRAILRTLRRHE